MSEQHFTEPTPEECSANALVFEDERTRGYAMWYPQMGGYVGRCIVFLDKKWVEYPGGSRSGGCFDVLVWHDGEFPFNEEGEGEKQNPARLHHCDPEQFIRFGEKVLELNLQGMDVV
jgi:hypothetical protein